MPRRLSLLPNRESSTDGTPVRPPDDVPLRTKRDPWRWVYGAALVILASSVAYTLVANEKFRWAIVAQYLFSPEVMAGLLRTLVLTVIAMVLGVVLGILTALLLGSQSRALRLAAQGYVWIFRGTPLLVQLIFWYNISALFPVIAFGVPFGPELFAVSTNTVVTVWVAAILGLSLNEGAYMAEIIRGGLLSVGRGQIEAGRASGMNEALLFRRIVLPQALRIAIPPTGNEITNMFKATALVSVLAVPDLLYSVQLIYTRTFQTIPLLIVACIWYLVFGSLLMVSQSFLERRFGRSLARSGK